MIPSLEQLEQLGAISRLDRHFARALGRLVDGSQPEVLVAAALASRAVQQGHVCADLGRLELAGLVDDPAQTPPDVELPAFASWRAALRDSPLVGEQIDEDEPRPLVLDPLGRLYLYRYARYQQRLVDSIRARTLGPVEVHSDALRAGLERLFHETGGGSEQQRRAALIAVLRAFTVISGGPGTGKTYTVAKILALLQEQAQALGRAGLRIVLLAPTGKAAQRLGESIDESVGALRCADEIKAAIPREAATIHRALGYQPRTPTQFRHDADNPLPADVVLVDEASMVDVALMAKLVVAVPPTSRLILLGDKDQLASVEAGAILGDIYGDHQGEGYSESFARAVAQVTDDDLPVSASRPEPGIHDCMIHLDFSYRFGDASGIKALADAINDGDGDQAVRAIAEHDDVSLRSLDAHHDLQQVLGDLVLDHYGPLGQGTAAEKLARLGQFKILCAHHRDRFGVEAVNRFVEQHLSDHGKLQIDRDWYDGRPIMITVNDYQLELFNGDVGVIARPGGSDELQAFFVGREGEPLRQLPPARLPPHQTVFAMSVHKSQGSEFDHLALLLPEVASPILTRELLYTGITRAVQSVSLFGCEAVLRQAIDKRIDRPSGLGDALWGLRDEG